ncbi:MAG: hypothetical protein CBB68_02910 [Rhodospirillaceae bacterium TMED8]|nr:MAG: hypothetical protein CBB68_02910 [Rhodospirillaceae bacterium TMED8]|tara:strand:+ start:69 stop:332 length:264 start_codon:yes stop_codon:yes gene_type:complete
MLTEIIGFLLTLDHQLQGRIRWRIFACIIEGHFPINSGIRIQGMNVILRKRSSERAFSTSYGLTDIKYELQSVPDRYFNAYIAEPTL